MYQSLMNQGKVATANALERLAETAEVSIPYESGKSGHEAEKLEAEKLFMYQSLMNQGKVATHLTVREQATRPNVSIPYESGKSGHDRVQRLSEQ